MTDIITPAGRLVQGKLAMQQRKDTKTKQPLFKDAAKTIPDMGLFFSLAFPKVLPNGQPNNEFNAFYIELVKAAAAAWPQFFPQGPQAVMGGGCTNPKFSWKYQDGDGTDTNGQSVANKPGFKGHHIIKFDTNFPVACYHQGQYRPDQEIGVGPNAPKPEDVIKRGYWMIVHAEVKSNNADLSQQQVPGISLYPKLVSFIGGRVEDEIKSGPDAMAVFGAVQPGGWRPDGVSSLPGAPVGLALPGAAPVLGAAPALGGLALPTPPALAAPVVPAAPTYVLRADVAAAGHTMQSLTGAGHTIEQLLAAGYITAQQPAPVLTPPTLALPVAPVLGVPLSAPVLTPPAPVYQLTPALTAQGVTMEALLRDGWTGEALVQQGHAVRIS